MRLTRTILLAALSTTVACGSDTLLTAQDELLLSAISGEEDYLSSAREASGEQGEAPADMGEEERAEGDRQGPPPMFRECDALGTYTGLFSAYDENEDGELGAPEQDEVMDEQQGPQKGPRDHLLGMLRVVYDVDADGQFSEAERATLLADFTERCENIHAQVLAEFDADGDGELNDEEQEAARTAHQERMEAARADMEECREAMGMDECEGKPEGGEGGERGGEGSEGGERGAPPEGAEGEGEGPPPIRGPLADEFDADGDGEISESELETLRADVRERITSGAPPHGECPVDTE
jgi:hypothetical protein